MCSCIKHCLLNLDNYSSVEYGHMEQLVIYIYSSYIMYDYYNMSVLIL